MPYDNDLSSRKLARVIPGWRFAASVTILSLIVSLPGLCATDNRSDNARLPYHRLTFRHYRATAIVSLLSITIFSRSGVGGGYASVEENGDGAGQNVILKFVSGSTPERAHGLNRLGLIQEVIRSREGVGPESEYFGFITSNGEESLAQAKKSLEENVKDKVNYAAAEGSLRGSNVRYAVRNMLLPSSYRWSNAQEFAREVQTDFFAGSGPVYHESSGKPANTFLYAVRSAILSNDPKSEMRVMHNSKFFHMKTEKALDQKVGEELRKEGVAEDAAHVMRLNGTIRNEKTNEETTYKLWYEEGSPNMLPLRFEFRPKSYLKLVFDADPTKTRPADLVLLTNSQ
jgi:hypothetical protein